MLKEMLFLKEMLLMLFNLGNNLIQNPQNNVVYSYQYDNPINNQNNIIVSPGNVDNTPHV